MSTNASYIDLTQRPPRSPRVRLGGYVILPRVIDKAHAALANKLGDYHYSGKGMDRHFFNFVGLDQESFTKEVAKGGGDSEILAWVEANAKHPRQPWEIQAWSQYHENRGPDSDAETLGDFATMLGKFSKTREDIKTWFALMELDDHCTFGGKP